MFVVFAFNGYSYVDAGSSCDDQLSSDFDNNGTNFTKNDYMAAMIGEQPSGDITILAPEYLQE